MINKTGLVFLTLTFVSNLVAASDDDFYSGYGSDERDTKWTYVAGGYIKDSYDPTYKYSIFELDGMSFDAKYELNENFFLEGTYLNSDGEVKSGGMGVLFLSQIETHQVKLGAGYKLTTDQYGDYFASIGYYERELTNEGHRITADEVDEGQYLTIGVKKAFTERIDIFAGGTYINLSEGTSIDGNDFESYYTLGASIYLTKRIFLTTFHNAYDEKNEWHVLFNYAL